MQIITGFHAIEEAVRAALQQPEKVAGLQIYCAKTGPRVKKILEQAKKAGIVCNDCNSSHLDSLTANLDQTARDHRGIVLVSQENAKENSVDFGAFISAEQNSNDKNTRIVVLLDSVTDPHNVGAIIRSCDQFGVDLVVLPERRGAKNSEIIQRSSAGASAWVPTAVVPNLVRAAEMLKAAGYWIYGADAGGESAQKAKLTGKIALVMGSEGTGISRLLENTCDGILSIPTCGRLDSLNVSVATGILLYEISRQNRQ